MALSESRPFILISRSFAQTETGALSQENYVPYVNNPIKSSIFEALTDDLSYNYPIVAMGNKDVYPDDFSSNALYLIEIPSSDVDWTEVFKELAIKALCVVVIPGYSKGFLKEIEILQSSGLTAKTLIFMWPSMGYHKNSFISNNGNQWSDVIQKMKDFGYHLPDHLNSGAILLVNQEFKVIHTEALISTKRVSEILKNITRTMQGSPLKDIALKIRDVELKSGNSRIKSIWDYAMRFRNK